MSYDEVISVMRPLVGHRVRVTALNGYQRVGVVSQRFIGSHDCLMLDNKLCGGEFDGMIRVEAMGTNGRYRVVAG